VNDLNIDLNLENFFHNSNEGIGILKDDSSFSFLNKGKQIRANIIFSLARILKIEDESAFTLARVIEMVHNATLSHDDIIDQASIRRGESSLAATYGNSETVLLGDYMLSKALVELAEVDNITVIRDLALCLKHLVDGEWIQLETSNPFSIDIERYIRLAELKTGSLFSWAFSSPAIVAKLDFQSIEQLQTIGNLIGVIFQIQDDLIDFSDQTGKEKHIDLKNNNPNIVLSCMGKLNSQENKFDQEKLEQSLYQTKAILDEKKSQLENNIHIFCSRNGKYQDFFKIVLDRILNRTY